MTKRLALLSLLLLLLPLLACTRQEPAATDAAAPATTTAAPAADAGAEPPAASDTAASDTSAAADGDASAQTPTATPAAPAAAPTPPQGPAPVVGEDYEIIQNGQPWQPLNGKIEVVEVFNYVCPACAAFQPLVNSWKKSLPADVRFTYVPAPFGNAFDPYVRAFYAAEAMGVEDKTHEPMFKAIHVDHTLKGEQGHDTPQDIAAFYGRYGVDPKQFASTMASFAVDGRFNRAKQFILREGVTGTPTIIVDGKYRIKGKSFPDILRIADHLIAQERAAGSTGG